MNDWFTTLVKRVESASVFGEATGAVVILFRETDNLSIVNTYGLGFVPEMPRKQDILVACAEECLDMVHKTAPIKQH